jgi:hypothetical protein
MAGVRGRRERGQRARGADQHRGTHRDRPEQGPRHGRIVVTVILVAIAAVLAFVPLPLWMVVEQAACGLLLLATAVIVSRVADQGLRQTET